MKIKSTLTLLAISVIALLASCKKSDKTSGDTPSKKLKYLTRSTIVDGSTTSFIDYTYDTKNRLSTIKNGTATSTYTYNGNNLVSVEKVDSSPVFRETIDFTYNSDGTISSAHDVIYRNGTLSSDIVFNYLVVNGRVTEIHHEGIYVDKYTYDDRGNVTNIYLAKSSYNNVFTFDDKPSPYTNGFPKYIINSDIQYVSPNNVLSNPPAPYAHTYTYGADGYPTGATVGSTKYSYTYTEM